MVTSSHFTTWDTCVTGVDNECRTIESLSKLKSRKFFAYAIWSIKKISVGETCAFKCLLEKANGAFLTKNSMKRHRNSEISLK